MSGRQGNKLPNNLPQLQNLIKRDPGSYIEEVRLSTHGCLLWFIMSDQHHVLSDQHHVLSDQHHVLSDQHHVLSDQHHVLSDQHHVLSDQHHVLSDQHHVLSDQHHVLSDQHHVLSDQHHVLSDQHHVLSDQHHVLSDYTMYCLIITMYCLIITTYCLINTTYCLINTTYCQMKTCFNVGTFNPALCPSSSSNSIATTSPMCRYLNCSQTSPTRSCPTWSCSWPRWVLLAHVSSSNSIATTSPMCRYLNCSQTSPTRSCPTMFTQVSCAHMIIWSPLHCAGKDKVYVVVPKVGHCYVEHLATFPQELTGLLLGHHTVLDVDLRMVRACYLLATP